MAGLERPKDLIFVGASVKVLRAFPADVRQVIGFAFYSAQRGFTQAETARILGVTQPKVSELFSGKLAGFSMERLIRFLTALDQDVRIDVSPKPPGRERAVVRVAASARRPPGA